MGTSSQMAQLLWLICGKYLLIIFLYYRRTWLYLHRGFLHDPEIYTEPHTFKPERYIATDESPSEMNPYNVAFGELDDTDEVDEWSDPPKNHLYKVLEEGETTTFLANDSYLTYFSRVCVGVSPLWLNLFISWLIRCSLYNLSWWYSGQQLADSSLFIFMATLLSVYNIHRVKGCKEADVPKYEFTNGVLM